VEYKDIILEACQSTYCEKCNDSYYDGRAGEITSHSSGCEGSQCERAKEDFIDDLESNGIILNEKSDARTLYAVSALYNIPLKRFGIEIDKAKKEKSIKEGYWKECDNLLIKNLVYRGMPNPIKKEKEIQMIKVIKETLKKYKLAVTLPGATDDNTTVTIDTKANKIYLEVDYSKTAKYVKEQLDLEHEGIFDIPERFEVARVEYDVNAGIVEMEIPVDDRVKIIKSKSTKKAVKKAIKK